MVATTIQLRPWLDFPTFETVTPQIGHFRPFCLILHSYLRQNGLLRQLASCTFSSNLRPFPQAFLLHTGNLKWLKSWYIQLTQWTVSFFLSILNFLVGIMSTISYKLKMLRFYWVVWKAQRIQWSYNERKKGRDTHKPWWGSEIYP